MKFKLWLENEWDDLYKRLEPVILASRDVQLELSNTGMVKIKTIEKALGVKEGEANFLAREFNKRHENKKQQQVFAGQEALRDLKARRDDYYYHILPKSRLKLIMKNGLLANQQATFSNYNHNSKDRIFLCEKEGLNFWKERIEQHLFHNGQNPNLVVVRIRKNLVSNVFSDVIGSNDSNTPAYFTTSSIAPRSIEVFS